MQFTHVYTSGVISELASKDLFTLDTTGDGSVTRRHPSLRRTGLKADEIIAARSAVAPVSSRKRLGDSSAASLPEKRRRADYVTHKEVALLRKVADGHHESTVTVTDATYDVWDNAPDRSEPAKEDSLVFVPKPQPKKEPKTLRLKPISLAASGKPISAVPKPAGGHSYNPNYLDYEKRLEEESTKVIEAETKLMEKGETDRVKAAAAQRSAAEAERAEARAELSEWDEDSAWEGFESGVEESVPVRRPERKTQVQRNRIKRRKEEERRKKHEAAIKKKEAQVHVAKLLVQEVAEKEQARALALAEASDDSEEATDDILRRRQLGKYKLPEKDLELVLPDELQDSLRLLKPEGNLLKDRYRSMLVRGKMESRRHIPFKKQAKGKVTEKWSYKDFVIP